MTGIDRPTLIVSSEDSPDVMRRVNDRLVAALPQTETMLVAGVHVIDPAHPAVTDFIGRVVAPLST